MATIKREKFMEIQKGHNVTMSLVMSVVLSVVLSVVPRTIWHDLADMQKKGVLIRNSVRKPCEDLVMWEMMDVKEQVSDTFSSIES